MGAALGALAIGLTVAAPLSALAQASRATTVVPSDKAKVTGSIVIDYNSRSERSTSTIDIYKIQDLAVADLMVLKGEIQRIPEKRMTYSVRLDVLNPANPSQVAHDAAILRGDLPINSNGRYNPEDGNLRLDVVKGNQASTGSPATSRAARSRAGGRSERPSRRRPRRRARPIRASSTARSSPSRSRTPTRCVSRASAWRPGLSRSSRRRRCRASSTMIMSSAIG